MIKAVREFSSQTKGEFTQVNIDEVMEVFDSIVVPQFKHEEIALTKEVEPNIKLKGNKIHIEEVLVNLAINAIHATKHNKKEKKWASLKIYKNTPNTFLIEFSDNGYGIKKDLIEDIFLDFVTTKASTEGTGMGLARVRKIVENHGGKVWAESKGEGQGAVFYAELPFTSLW